MKKWITLNLCLLLSGFLAGQSENKETQPVKGYEINGFITGKYTGKVYLVKEDGMHGPQTKVDSCEVKEGRFRFKGDTVPEYSVIYFIQSHDGQLAPVFLEAGQMNMTMRADYFLGSVTKGTINNNLWSLHQLQTRYWIDSMLLASNTHYMRYGRGSFAVEDSLFKYRTWEQNTKKLNMEKYMARFYNDQAFAPFIMLFEMTNELSLDELKELRGQLNEKLNNHPYTKELDEIIANKEFKVGVEAPEFSIKGMDGEDIELKNFAGKYILLDFWASWCGPCRNEMPNVVKLYKECKGKNFEIIGPETGTLEKGCERPEDDLAAGLRLPGMVRTGGTQIQPFGCPLHRTDQPGRKNRSPEPARRRADQYHQDPIEKRQKEIIRR